MPEDNPPIGTLVTCENGHRICEIVGPIADWREKTALSAGFGNYTPGEKLVGPGDIAAYCRCQQCGAPWVDVRPNVRGTLSAKVHLETGWWP